MSRQFADKKQEVLVCLFLSGKIIFTWPPQKRQSMVVCCGEYSAQVLVPRDVRSSQERFVCGGKLQRREDVERHTWLFQDLLDTDLHVRDHPLCSRLPIR